MTAWPNKAPDPSKNVYLDIALPPRPVGPNIWTGFSILPLAQVLVKEIKGGRFFSLPQAKSHPNTRFHTQD